MSIGYEPNLGMVSYSFNILICWCCQHFILNFCINILARLITLSEVGITDFRAWHNMLSDEYSFSSVCSRTVWTGLELSVHWWFIELTCESPRPKYSTWWGVGGQWEHLGFVFCKAEPEIVVKVIYWGGALTRRKMRKGREGLKQVLILIPWRVLECD